MMVALLAFISRATALIDAPSASRWNVSSRCLSDSTAGQGASAGRDGLRLRAHHQLHLAREVRLGSNTGRQLLLLCQRQQRQRAAAS